ncbi:hypothetical protein [Tateyamaria sp.]|uniref:hypothetical protein n=1 Tax=Tateyamaria sp. TaxID=1929288 RepID=UPI00329B4600
MPQKIDGLTYPSTVAELLANRELSRMMLQTYTSNEVKNRIKFLINPPKRAVVYTDYIAPNASNRIDLPNHIKAMATDLIQSNDHEPRLWQGIADLVEANCRNFIEQEIMSDFFDVKSCPAFKSHHTTRLLAAAEKKFGSADDISIRLNVSDMSALRGVMVCMIKGDKSGAVACAKVAIRSGKLTASPAEFIDAVKTKKGLTVTGAFKVDITKLKLCGFEKPDAKVRNRIEDMVNSWMSGDKTTAKAIFKLLQKSAAPGSFLNNETIESLFKTFKRFKVVVG